MTRPPREDVEEVRVALALNGGVSLAVWMGGAAVELDAARRAHLPGCERPLYAAICAAFQRELVLDLMTGSSAGGINGALLAGAVAWRRRLPASFLRERWIRLGDASCLLHRRSEPRPESLLRGDYFARELATAFEELHRGDCDTRIDPQPPAGALAAGVRIEITTTDMRGGERRYRDVWGEDLVAREYRRRFCFEAKEGENGLAPGDLAVAARASASFPVAFEPAEVPAGLLPGLDGTRHVLDGGLLDNAPIRALLDLIPTRAASRQVRRYVCYLNADPPLPEFAPEAGVRPGLPRVAAAVLGLPRKATFVDHLDAIERATREGRLALTGEQDLLELDRGTLDATARALLPAYRQRRRILSLEEALGDPSAVAPVERALRGLPGDLDLPWIPVSLDPPDGRWEWGVRAAQRSLHLLIDALRAALPRQRRRADRHRLFAARLTIDERIAALDDVHAALRADAAIDAKLRALPRAVDLRPALEELRELMRPYDVAILAAVRAGAEAGLGVADLLPARQADGLFGPSGTLETFIARSLAIEVLRRAFHAEEPFDTAQRLLFAQITPFAPALVLAPEPLAGRIPGSSPRDKLSGLPIAHFAAFHRASWRANDFMWGRLDGAVRVVDLLVDAARAREVAGVLGGRPPWEVLAAALVADGSPAARALLEEALDDPDDDLEEALRQDLQEGDGRLTRVICARALQLEVLQDELPGVVAASRDDAALGTGVPALALPADPLAAIRDLRTGPPLPQRLGVAATELASDLALRTLSHAALVALAAVRTAGVPLADAVGALRVPLLPVAGAVAHPRLLRLPVVALTAAFAVWIAWRCLVIRDGDALDPPRAPALDDVSLGLVAVSLLAVGGIAGAAALSGWRGIRARGGAASAFHFLAAMLLAGGGLIVPVGAAVVWGGLDLAELIAQPVAPGVRTVPGPLFALLVVTSAAIPLLVALGAVRVLDRARVRSVLARTGLQERVDRYLSSSLVGLPSVVLLLLPWLALLVICAPALIAADGGGWRELVRFAPVVALLGSVLALLVRPRPAPVAARGLGLPGPPAPGAVRPRPAREPARPPAG